MQLTCVVGTYRLSDETGTGILRLETNETVTVANENGRVKVSKNEQTLGSFKTLNVKGESAENRFKLSPSGTLFESRQYDDHLKFTASNKLTIINIVDLENYVAGVVQSEVFGCSDDIDFYKVQAIISRTYVMNHLSKHRKDGCNLCDGVHCQVYKKRNTTEMIHYAAIETAGLVLVDKNNKLISAAFHSNSGGQTTNSEDVWINPLNYLRSVTDTFSLDMKNSTWQKTYTTKEWLDIFQKRYSKYDMPREKALNFEQNERKTHFHGKIPLTKMRTDLGLRSTFFSVRQEGDTVVLSGKGYGHGCGLSQEGAVRMVQEGYCMEDVLKFYYNNVNIVNLDSVSFPTKDIVNFNTF
ncbi:MAG: SpoIID/LytB domain-containing protein [Bacteroidales bacterium]|nr:SpoIID/LytB domain-containing protein [Bacteroidales bacterium]